MRRQQSPEADADELVRDVQHLARSHREQQALLGEVVDSVGNTRGPDGMAIAYLPAGLLAELRRRTGR